MKQSFTELRKEILAVIEESEQPLMAEEVFDRLPSKLNLSTVYRAIDFLLKKGLIKAAAFSSEAKFFYSGKKEHSHFIYCKGCSKIEEFDRCFAQNIQNDVESELDYKITDHFFYFAGICNSCRKIKFKEGVIFK